MCGRGASVNSYELSRDCTAQLEDDVHGTVFMDRYSCLCYRKNTCFCFSGDVAVAEGVGGAEAE